MKPVYRLKLGLHRLAKANGGAGQRVVGFGAPIQMVGDRRIELRLSLERRADEAPDEPGEAAFQPPIDSRRSGRQDLRAVVDRREPLAVGRSASQFAPASSPAKSTSVTTMTSVESP